MSTRSQGDAAFITNQWVMVEQGWFKDQEGRQTWMQTFEGTQTGIETLRVSFIGAGAVVNARFVPGGRSVLTASWPYQPGTTETAEEVWYYEEVPTQPSIWTHPVVAPVLTAAYKSNIEEKLRNNEANPYGSATSGSDLIMRNVFDRLQRGTEAWEANKPIVRRTRSFSTAFAGKTTLTLTTTVYSRASLISTFSVPAGFQPQIPVDPTWTASPATTWGWRKGPQSSGYNRATRRYEETILFEGGFWDQALYTFT